MGELWVGGARGDVVWADNRGGTWWGENRLGELYVSGFWERVCVWGGTLGELSVEGGGVV